jgi:hypothetical protein
VHPGNGCVTVTLSTGPHNTDIAVDSASDPARTQSESTKRRLP